MARIIPDDFDPMIADQSGHHSESRTLARLREGLSDRYTIYHNVRWARAERSGSVYGEIDFIVSNPRGCLLAIEQKDTEVAVLGGDLIARYRTLSNRGVSEDKIITTQVNRNLNGLRDQFARRYSGRGLDIDHLLYLPQARLGRALPSSVDPTRLVDAERDAQLIDVIESLLDLTSGPSVKDPGDPFEIEDFLSQRLGVAPHIGVLGKAARQFTTHLSGGLSTWASRFSLSPWRLRVRGTAGSGKTQLALQELRLAHQNKQSALYICYNRPLADAMKLTAPDPSMVVTFHELAKYLVEQTGRVVDFGPPSGRGAVYAALAAEFIELSRHLAGTLDTLVIDEGQDLHSDWSESLLALAKPNGRVLWLEDPEQSLYGREAADLSSWATLRSPINYRSPQLLVEFINWLALTDEPIEAGSAIRGFDPIWRVVPDGDTESMIDTTAREVKNLLEQGYSVSNIAVLSFHGIASSLLVKETGPKHLAGIRLRRQSQDDFNPDGTAVWTDGELLVDTLFRFKGQAADAVVITEIDFDELDLNARRRLFVALTRARLQAVLVTTESAAKLLQERLDHTDS